MQYLTKCIGTHKGVECIGMYAEGELMPPPPPPSLTHLHHLQHNDPEHFGDSATK